MSSVSADERPDVCAGGLAVLGSLLAGSALSKVD